MPSSALDRPTPSFLWVESWLVSEPLLELAERLIAELEGEEQDDDDDVDEDSFSVQMVNRYSDNFDGPIYVDEVLRRIQKYVNL